MPSSSPSWIPPAWEGVDGYPQQPPAGSSSAASAAVLPEWEGIDSLSTWIARKAAAERERLGRAPYNGEQSSDC